MHALTFKPSCTSSRFAPLFRILQKGRQRVAGVTPRCLVLKLPLNPDRSIPLPKCQTLAKTQTKRHVRSSVRLSVNCVCQGRPSYGWTKRDALWKFMEVNQSTNIYTKFGQLIIGKIIKILPSYCDESSVKCKPTGHSRSQ